MVASTDASQLIEEGQTREVFWQFPVWAEVLWYGLAVASVLVFAYGVAKPVAKYRQGRGTGLPPARELPRRVRHALGLVLSQTTVRRRDGLAGWAHAGIFYGFVVLFAGTVVLAINTDVTERFFGWRFFTGDFYLGYSAVLDVMGVALLLGVLAMMFRRAVIRPRKLDYRIGDWIFVGGLLYLVVTGYLLEGVRLAMDVPGNEAANPVGWLAGQSMTGLSYGTLEVLRHGIWWSHGLVAIVFVAALPYTKGMHMLTSFASLVLRDDHAGKRLAGIPADRIDDPVGYATLDDFSPLHLLQLDACTRCGKCHEACPANATGQPLSPRDVILELREQANDAWAPVGVGGILGSLLGSGEARPLGRAAAGPDAVRPETVWSCYQCNACVEPCPVGIEQAPIINQLRRSLLEEGEVPEDLQRTLETISKSGNSFGENRRRRGRWTDELDFEVPDARKEAVDLLWFVGDYASFDPRSQQVSRTLARLYRAAGLRFGILYEGERNAGNDVRRIGEEGLWEELAASNIATLSDARFDRIVTSDPHSLNTLRNEYADAGAEAWTVVHHTTVMRELLESGALAVERPLGYRVTYHDPCYLGRHNGEYEGPRRILELLGCVLVEMPRNRDNSFCCGAGGGRIWTRDAPGGERPSENRIREAASLGRLDYFVVSCPKDVTMYEDAIKTSGHAAQLELKEMAELVAEACGIT